MMQWYDWLIVIVPTLFVLGMGVYTRRYLKDVTTFLSSGRICGRYVIAVGDVAASLSIIGLVSYVEIHYKTGFALAFWSSLTLPIGVVMGLFGYCMYRFRETKAQSIGQFFEMRYSRSFRIFAAALRSVSEMLANMIMPALAARFFIYFLDLPEHIQIGAWSLSTFHLLMLLVLTIAIFIICMGGAMGIIVTDTLQGFICYPLMTIFVVFVLVKFSWSDQIIPVMQDRAANESFLNPYDISNLRDFNFFFLMVTVMASFLHRASWTGSGGSSSAARSPHEQKMASLLGTWRQAIGAVFYVLISVALLTMLNHHSYAEKAHQIRLELTAKVATEVVHDQSDREQVIASLKAMPVQKHVIGQEAPLSDKNNIDTRYLNVAHTQLQMLAFEQVSQDNAATVKKVLASQKNAGKAEVADDIASRVFAKDKQSYKQLNALSAAAAAENDDAEDAEKPAKMIKSEVDSIANPVFAKFRTLYYQLMLPVTLRNMLPGGMMGLFCVLMILLMLSTDDSRIFSAAITISQDVILPFRKKALTPKEHMWMIRWVSIGIGIFFFLGSSFMAQLDYIQLYVVLVTTMWLGGCGPVIVFGLYSRIGTAAGAWFSLVNGMVMAIIGAMVQRNWADIVYPFLEKHGMVSMVGGFLEAVSKPFNPYIVWTMDAVKCPINSYEWYFLTMVTSLLLYWLVSFITCKEKFNLERMLHRGKYGLDEQRVIKSAWSWENLYNKLIGITPEYSRSDKLIAWCYFAYSIIYKFGFAFIMVLIWNAISPWPIEYWSSYFLIVFLLVPGAMAAITAVWFGIGGFKDLRQMFRDLESRVSNPLDDGRVEGHMSLADKAQLEALDKKDADK